MIQEGNKTLVSVIVPFFNPGHAICKTIESILNQTYDEIELILVDDGSNDSTYSEISRYLHFESVYLYENQFAKGQSGASNFGVTKSNGIYIKFVDADDWLSPEHIELCIQAIVSRGIADNCIDVALVAHEIVSEEGELIERHGPGLAAVSNPSAAFASLMNGHEMLAAWKWFIPKQAFTLHALSWDETLTRNKDFVFSSDLLRRCCSVIPVTGAIYYYVKTPSSEGKRTDGIALNSLIAAHRKGVKNWVEPNLIRAFDLRLRKLQQYIYSYDTVLADSLDFEIQNPDKYILFGRRRNRMLARFITWRGVRNLGRAKRQLRKFFSPFNVPGS